MKTISRWASSHVRTAILIIVICEVLNAFSGLLLGMNLLEGWPMGGLLLLAVVLGGGAVLVRLQYRSDQPYVAARRWLFGAFLSNFLLFGLLGGLWAESVQSPTPNRAVWGSRRMVMRSDTIIKPATKTSINQADYYASRTERSRTPTGSRILFISLFVLGIVLSGLVAALACNLACTGYGVGAVVMFVAGVGVFAGGFFFLSRALEKVIKPWREMSRSERRRIWLRALPLLLGFLALAFILIN